MKSITQVLLSFFFPPRQKPRTRLYIDSANFDPSALPKPGSALIMTACNEADTIFERVQSVKRGVAGVVVIDQGSTDGTPYFAAEAGAVIVMQEAGMTVDEAVRKAVRAAKHFSQTVQFVENCN